MRNQVDTIRRHCFWRHCSVQRMRTLLVLLSTCGGSVSDGTAHVFVCALPSWRIAVCVLSSYLSSFPDFHFFPSYWTLARSHQMLWLPLAPSLGKGTLLDLLFLQDNRECLFSN
jgi:hypothetical protein